MDTVEEIQKRLTELRKQGLEMLPPLEPREVEEAETHFNVKFPDPYRRIILTLGNGGDRFFFPLRKDAAGLWTFDGDGDKSSWLREFLPKPFPHLRKTAIQDHPFFTESDWAERWNNAETDDETDELWDWFEEHRDEIIDEAWLDRHFQGSAAIKHYGCAIRDRLVVSGDLAGTVWHSPEGLDFELCPRKNEGGDLIRFDEWLLDLLIRRLAGDDWV
jgi:hypothetical protein